MTNHEKNALLVLKQALLNASDVYNDDASEDFIDLIDGLGFGRSIDEIASEIDTKRGR